MFKIKGYLKKFWYLILACICLLFVQAQTELTLPDYMSDIVSGRNISTFIIVC